MKQALIACQQDRDVLVECLQDEYRIQFCDSLGTCLTAFRRSLFDLTVLDIGCLYTANEGNIRSQIRRNLKPFFDSFPEAVIVVCTPHERTRDGVAAVRSGASNYLTYPLHPSEVTYALHSIAEESMAQVELDYLRDEVLGDDVFREAPPQSPLMKEILRKARMVAQTRTTVLLSGETGTGKGVVAEHIHRLSNRRGQQYVSVHCGAIPDNLLESELFGHERGAFTGAFQRSLGKFEVAHGGTLFLDEVGTLSPAAQIKLLQVLQERVIRRVGGLESIPIDVRIIAATNIDLAERCAAGAFRQDLFYRLNVFPLEIPPLRQRMEDLPVLVNLFLDELNRMNVKKLTGIQPATLEALKRYDWPGNVRELENLIERAFILEESDVLTPASLPPEIADPMLSEAFHDAVDTDLPLASARKAVVDAFEYTYLKNQLQRCEGKIQQAAVASGITPRQLHKLLSKHSIKKEEFRTRRFRGQHTSNPNPDFGTKSSDL